MNINATLLGQMITFALFVWFTMKFVWPLLEKTLKERQEKIAEGLSAAERGHHELEIAQKYAVQQIREAREKATETVELARKQALTIVEEAKAEALVEKEKIMAAGNAEVEQKQLEAREQLKGEVIQLAIQTAEKMLKRNLNEKDQQNLLDLKGILGE